jgi:hypothetical protein
VVGHKGFVDSGPIVDTAVDRERPFAPPCCEMCCAFRRALVVAVGMFAMWVLSA